MLSFNLIYNLEAVAALLKIFMGLALVHFQKYWLLRVTPMCKEDELWGLQGARYTGQHTLPRTSLLMCTYCQDLRIKRKQRNVGTRYVCLQDLNSTTDISISMYVMSSVNSTPFGNIFKIYFSFV